MESSRRDMHKGSPLVQDALSGELCRYHFLEFDPHSRPAAEVRHYDEGGSFSLRAEDQVICEIVRMHEPGSPRQFCEPPPWLEAPTGDS